MSWRGYVAWALLLLLLLLLAPPIAFLIKPYFAHDWQTVAPDNGGFSAEFPGLPMYLSKRIEGGIIYGWGYIDKKQELMVMATTMDFYGASPAAGASEEVWLARAEMNYLRRVNGTATSSKQGTIAGAGGKMLPVLRFTFVTATGGEGVSQEIGDGETVYMSVVSWGKGVDAAEVRERFMASYKLLPRTKPPVMPAAEY